MEIRIAAAAILRPDGATLLVRKRGTSVFMQPGGKIDAGESPLQALCRELYEELGLTIHPDAPRHIGRVSAPAVHEPGFQVTAELYLLTLAEDITPRAEIEEIRWIRPEDPGGLPLAPLTRDKVLPAIRALA